MGFAGGILGGGGGSSGPQNNLTAVGAPAVTDDSGDGYSQLSTWIDTSVTPKEIYVCIDATLGAAVWLKTTLTIDELGTMATQDSYEVTITGGSISGVLITADGVTMPVTNIASSAGSDNITGGSNRLYRLTGTLTHTFVLPTNPTVGTRYRVVNSSTGALTIARGGSDTINGATSFVMAANDFFEFEIVAANTWIVRY